MEILRHGYTRILLPCRFISSISRSHYDILGVSKNATFKEIKLAFYDLSKKYHPDVVGSDNESVKKFLEIKEAYEFLSDPEHRRSYNDDDRPINPAVGRSYQKSSSSSSSHHPTNRKIEDGHIISVYQMHKDNYDDRIDFEMEDMLEHKLKMAMRRSLIIFILCMAGTITSVEYSKRNPYHPDVVGSNNESAKKFLEIKEAYEVLKDPDQRRDYDAGLLNSRHSYQTTYGSTSSTQYSQHFHDFARRQQKNPWQSSRYNYNRDFEWWSKSNPEWSRDFERIWEKIKNDQKIRDDKANKEFYREWHRRVYEDHDRRRETRWSSSQNAWNWNEKEKTEQEKLLSEFMKIFNIAFISIMGLIIVTSFINLMRQRMNAIKSFRDVERRGDKMFPVSDRDMYNLRKIMETPPGPPPPRPSSNIWGEESLPYERYVPEYKTSYDN